MLGVLTPVCWSESLTRTLYMRHMSHAVIRLVAPLIAVACTLATASLPVDAQATLPVAPSSSVAPDSARLALARELMEAMRVGPMMLQGIEQGLASQKAASPNLPEAFWTEFAARARDNLPKFIESVVPVYASRFTAKELQEMIAFYRTAAGSHLAAEGGAISTELMRQGQLWGMQLGADTVKDLAAKGVMLP